MSPGCWIFFVLTVIHFNIILQRMALVQLQRIICDYLVFPINLLELEGRRRACSWERIIIYIVHCKKKKRKLTENSREVRKEEKNIKQHAFSNGMNHVSWTSIHMCNTLLLLLLLFLLFYTRTRLILMLRTDNNCGKGGRRWRWSRRCGRSGKWRRYCSCTIYCYFL